MAISTNLDIIRPVLAMTGTMVMKAILLKLQLLSGRIVSLLLTLMKLGNPRRDRWHIDEVPQKDRIAWEEYAKQGDADAQYNLGNMYHKAKEFNRVLRMLK